MRRLDCSSSQLTWGWSIRRWHGLFLVVIMLFSMIPVVWGAGIATIIELSEPQNAFEVMLGGSTKITEKLVPFVTKLQAGDTVKVIKKDCGEKPCFMTLGDNGVSKTLTFDNTRDHPYKIEDVPTTTIFGEVLKNIKDSLIFIKAKEFYVQALKSGPPDSTTEPLTAPLLKPDVTAKLVSDGKNGLSLAWYGGKKPYTLAVYQGKTLLLEQKNIQTEGLKLDSQAFGKKNGTYRIVLSDSSATNSNPIESKIEWVTGEKSILSKVLDIQLDKNLSPSAQQTLSAAWLITQDKGMWSLEAYQHVVKEANYLPALWIKTGLENGIMP
ncbi:MAG: hypothetical protein BWK78_03545 [Thiotrichaceae bacterium IS1]|nr:MAG: hypothetical protein BWK78_03545 [Thiotrichaceae bacterium IS1]